MPTLPAILTFAVLLLGFCGLVALWRVFEGDQTPREVREGRTMEDVGEEQEQTKGHDARS